MFLIPHLQCRHHFSIYIIDRIFKSLQNSTGRGYPEARTPGTRHPGGAGAPRRRTEFDHQVFNGFEQPNPSRGGSRVGKGCRPHRLRRVYDA